MKIYITAPFKGKENKEEIEKLCDTIKKTGLEDFCFIRDIEKYELIFDNPNELMKQAITTLSTCDMLLIDSTTKTTTGCTIEAGMAYALGKKIITIAKTWSDIRPTLQGISSIIITYETIEDIIEPIKDYHLSLK